MPKKVIWDSRPVPESSSQSIRVREENEAPVYTASAVS